MSHARAIVFVKNTLLLWTVIASIGGWRMASILTGFSHFVFFCCHLEPLERKKVRDVFEKLVEQCQTNEQPLILHRAGGDLGPENSIQSIKEAASRKVIGVEIDITYTLDGQAVLFHDPTVDRLSDSTGKVAEMTFDQLQKVNIAAKHPLRHELGFVSIPKVEDAVQECLKLNLFMLLDLKAVSRPEETAYLLNGLYLKYPDLYSKSIVISFFPHLLYKVRTVNPEILTGLIYRECALEAVVPYLPPQYHSILLPVAQVLDVPFNWLQKAWLWYLCGTSVVTVYKDNLSRTTLEYWRNMGLEVIAWSVNDLNEKKYLLEDLKVPIISDDMNPKLTILAQATS